jgi:acetyl esterase
MPDSEIDPEIRAFIKKTEAFYGDVSLEDVAAQRRCYDAMCAAFNEPYPAGVNALDHDIDNNGYQLGLRSYTLDKKNSNTVVVYYHGGGFVLGDLESHDSVCAEICGSSGFDVLSVDYRLAPEHHFPEDLEDALAGFRHAADRYPRVIVAGDSAGGNLAAAVAIATRNERQRPAAQVLIYPALGGDLLGLDSYTANARSPMLTVEQHAYYIAVRSINDDDLRNPLFLPLNLEEYGGLPSCAAFSADIDPIRDDAGEYVRRLDAAGVEASWTNEAFLPHGFLRARHHSSRAADSFSRICKSIGQLAYC